MAMLAEPVSSQSPCSLLWGTGKMDPACRVGSHHCRPGGQEAEDTQQDTPG